MTPSLVAPDVELHIIGPILSKGNVGVRGEAEHEIFGNSYVYMTED